MVKTCARCKLTKIVENYSKSSISKDGFYALCKPCYKIYAFEYQQKNLKNLDVIKANLISKICTKCNLEKLIKSFGKQTRNKDGLTSRCKLCMSRATANYKLSNPEKVKLQSSTHKNKPETKKKRNLHLKKKRDTDPGFKLIGLLRNRLRQALRNHALYGSSIHDLGCSIFELKIHLESQFQFGMTWENHNQHGWHIDHIKPLSSFDLTNREEFLKACHYTNLQPLWAKENLQKSNKVS